MQPPRNQKKIHESVLVAQVIKAFRLPRKAHLNHQARDSDKQEKLYIDTTLGTGGHAINIINRGGYVLGIETDKRLYEVALARLKSACPTPHPNGERCFKLIQGNFKHLKDLVKNTEFNRVEGVLFDLGVSNIHFQDEKRGFSFKFRKAFLDMRLNQKIQGVTAADLLNSLRQDQLEHLFAKTLSFLNSKKLAKKVVLARKKKKFRLVEDLLEVTGTKKNQSKLHPATKPMLALRIAVNSELENLKEALPEAFEILKSKGRLAVISFHSQEDALVKNFYKKMNSNGFAEIITKKPILPTELEVIANPKARSAKLRILQKV